MADDVAIFRLRGRHVACACLVLAWTAGALMPGAAAARVPEILAFGDSLTAGYGLPEAASFPAQLQARLAQQGITAHVVNGGSSGDTTAGGLARLDWSLAQKPDLVILELGANEMLHGTDPQTVRANLDAMIRKIKASGAKVLLAGMKAAPNWGAPYQQAFDHVYPDLAKTDGITLYPFFLEGVALKPALNQPDGRHPNARGVAVIVDRILPYVARLIGKPLDGRKLIGKQQIGAKS